MLFPLLPPGRLKVLFDFEGGNEGYGIGNRVLGLSEKMSQSM